MPRYQRPDTSQAVPIRPELLCCGTSLRHYSTGGQAALRCLTEPSNIATKDVLRRSTDRRGQHARVAVVAEEEHPRERCVSLPSRPKRRCWKLLAFGAGIANARLSNPGRSRSASRLEVLIQRVLSEQDLSPYRRTLRPARAMSRGIDETRNISYSFVEATRRGPWRLWCRDVCH